MQFWQHTGRFLYLMYRRFCDDHVMRMSASLSYSTLLALVPFFIVSVYILSIFPWFRTVAPEFQHFLVSNFVVSASNNLNQAISVFVNKMSSLKWTNICALSMVSMLLMTNMVSAFNDIWHVESRYHFAWHMLFYWIFVLLMPIAFASILLIGPYIFSIKLFYGHLISVSVIDHVLPYIPFLSAFFVFTIGNWLLPSALVKLRHALLAGLLTAILFTLAKYIFSFYIQFFNSYELVYGALAAIPFLLSWVYISWLIIFTGAQFCHILSVGIIKSINE